MKVRKIFRFAKIVFLFCGIAEALLANAAASPTIHEISPVAGSCGALVTLTGEYFGSTHTSQRTVVFAGPVPATSPVTDMPIYTWSDSLIEIEIPCWTFAPGDHYVQVRTEWGNSNIKVFSVREHPTVFSILPSAGPCRTIMGISGSGGFDGVRHMPPSAVDGYHGIGHVVDFVAPSRIYTATLYGAGGLYPWTNTKIYVMFGDLFEDQTDPNTGERNFVRDDGSMLCPVEPLIRRCEDLFLGVYSVYVKAIYYGDDDGNDMLNCGDTIFEVEKSDPVYFELTKEPVIHKLSPRQIERSYYCDHDLDPFTDPVLINNVLTIYGQNLGHDQNSGDVVKIGTAAQYDVNPLTSGIVLPRVQWDSLSIRVGIDKPHVPDGAAGRNDVRIWVIKDGAATNALPLEILPDSCP